jgi:PAS domain S-box-containing protein
LSIIMVAVSLLVGAGAIGLLYKTAISEEKNRLLEIVSSAARLMESIAAFDAQYSQDYPGGNEQATFDQVFEAFDRTDWQGQTGQFVVGRRKGNRITFLYRHSLSGGKRAPEQISVGTAFAEPMQKALAGKYGFMLGRDYQGDRVLAAYSSVAGLDVGLVAKIDLSEVRAPFVHTGVFIGIICLALILGGIFLFFRVSDPIIKEIGLGSEQLWTTLKSIGDAVIATDDKGTVVLMNPVAEELTGWMLRKARGRHVGEVFQIVNEQTGKEVESPVAQVLREGVIVGLANHTLLVRKDGTRVPIDDSGAPIRNPDGALTGVVLVFRDITEKKTMETELRASERKLRTRSRIAEIFLLVTEEEAMFSEILELVLETMESKYGVFGFIDEQGAFVVPSMTRHVWDKCNVQEKRFIFPREQWGDSSWPRAIREKKANYSNSPSTLVPEGHIGVSRHISLPIVFQGEVVGLFQVANKETDYTEEDVERLNMIADIVAPTLDAHLKEARREVEKARLEKHLLQAQKMEAIGTLAGGIAHDFNNVLGIMLGNMELATLDIPAWSPAGKNLENIRKACFRARDMVLQILAFSRQSDKEMKSLRLGFIVNQSLKMLRATIPSTVDIREDFSAATDLVLADPTQVSQVLMNLCTNAAHAMRKKGGVLSISLSNRALSDKTGETPPGLSPGEYVILTVSDTGHGIPPEIMGRIFEPYYTTKEAGEGTGMGLAMVDGFVKDHGGIVLVRSKPGEGSAFEVFFPLHHAEAEPEEDEPHPLPKGKEKILFVDDEKDLADIGKQMLEQLQYEVTIQTDCLKALALFREAPDRFDLVVTDMTMPHMTGADLALELMTLRPDVPIVLCTGFSEMISGEKAEKMGIRAFVTKPLSLRVLAETVRKVLDQAKG